MDREGGFVHPIGGFREALYHCPYPFGIDIALLILPSFLQIEDDRHRILPGHSAFPAKSGAAYAVLLRHGLDLVIKANRCRPFGERDARLNVRLGVLRARDGLTHTA